MTERLEAVDLEKSFQGRKAVDGGRTMKLPSPWTSMPGQMLLAVGMTPVGRHL